MPIFNTEYKSHEPSPTPVYTQLEYIKTLEGATTASTGPNILADAGMDGSQRCKIEFTFMMDSVKSNSNYFYANADGTGNFSQEKGNSYSYILLGSNTTAHGRTSNGATGVKYAQTVELNNGTATMTGLCSGTSSYAGSVIVNKMWIGGPGTLCANIKIYGVKMRQGNSSNLIHNYVPAEYEGVVGMYDTIDDKFYGSNNSYTFIAGPEVYFFSF